MTTPIEFECSQVIPKSANVICAEIANLDRWPEFEGYAFLPGIQSATFEKQTEDMLGTRIRVLNKDGSTHVEEIYAWEVGQKVSMKLHEFSPPLSRLATHFNEEWDFQDQSGSTMVTRKFQLFPKNMGTRPFLWLISLFFKRAIAQHLEKMAKN